STAAARRLPCRAAARRRAYRSRSGRRRCPAAAGCSSGGPARGSTTCGGGTGAVDARCGRAWAGVPVGGGREARARWRSNAATRGSKPSTTDPPALPGSREVGGDGQRAFAPRRQLTLVPHRILGVHERACPALLVAVGHDPTRRLHGDVADAHLYHGI